MSLLHGTWYLAFTCWYLTFTWIVRPSGFDFWGHSSLFQFIYRTRKLASHLLSKKLGIFITYIITWTHCTVRSLFSYSSESISSFFCDKVHVAASECLLEITLLLQSLPTFQRLEIGFKGELHHQYEIEKNQEAKSILKKCIDIIQSLEEKSMQNCWESQFILISL